MTKGASLIAVLAASMVSGLMCGPLATAQDARATAGATTARDQPPTTGIKVHGHWAVEVRNRDGSVASHDEFENSCIECGQAIAAVLARQRGTWQWAVLLNSTIVQPQEVCSSSGASSPCQILEVGQSDKGQPDAYFPNMTVTSDLGAGTLEFNGHITATFDGSISQVAAAFVIPDPNQWIFSYRQLSAIQIAAGQQVYVKVTFSFS